MRFFSKPRVTTIAHTTIRDGNLYNRLLELGYKFDTDAVTDADELAEVAGRLCYMSFNADKRRKSGEGQNKAYLDHIKNVGHLSVIEHASWTFLITDVSRNLTHELIRHRVGTAISQVSSRYVDHIEHDLGYYLPDEATPVTIVLRRKAIEYCEDNYRLEFEQLKQTGMNVKNARSIARHELHGSAGTALVWTCNARELDHIFKLRGSIHADPEIRKLAVELWKQVKDVEIFSHWTNVNGELVQQTTDVLPAPVQVSATTALSRRSWLQQIVSCVRTVRNWWSL